MVKKKFEMAVSLEDMQAELAEAIVQLSEAFDHGTDAEVSSLTAVVRACEQAINDAYYRRWGTP